MNRTKTTASLYVLIGFFLLFMPITASRAEQNTAPRANSADSAATSSNPLPEQQKSISEKLYTLLSSSRAEDRTQQSKLAEQLLAAAQNIKWQDAKSLNFQGHLRFLQIPKSEQDRDMYALYLIRDIAGQIFVLVLPAAPAQLKPEVRSAYAELQSKTQYKLSFAVSAAVHSVDGTDYRFAKLLEAPQRLALDRLFFIAIIVLLFLTMVGMGLTLTINDFALVFKKPLAMILGPIFQFLFMPLLAMLLGYISGYYETYPFIYLGMLLIAVTPGGVTSNLMTYLGKGDVALSVSLTALCTVLSLFCTPLILTLFAAHIPSFQLPVMAIFSQILILVVIPLFIGMLVRSKSENFAKKAEKPFAGIGLFALLFLIVVGIWGNLEKFADTDRYGFKFYAIIFVFTLVGMIGSGLLAKLLRINNFQARAVSLECGLRNASLAMTIALLIQDRIGDFYSSVFFTSGIFGIWMYFAGAISIFTFKKWLPVSSSTDKA